MPKQSQKNERVFYAILDNQGSSDPRWHPAQGVAYGLPPNAFLDLGGELPLAWVLVVCRGRGCTIACEEAYYEAFYDAAPEPSGARSFRLSRRDSLPRGEAREKARFEATFRHDLERYRRWRAQVAACVSSPGYFARIGDERLS